MPTIDEDLIHDLMVKATSDLHAPTRVCTRVIRERRRSRKARRTLIATSVTALTTAAAAIAVATVASAPTAPHDRTSAASTVPTTTKVPATTRAHAPVASPLVRLADYIGKSAHPVGNATLVARTTGTGTGAITVYDLYADNGEYFFSRTESGLAGQVKGNDNQANGLFAREIKAAKLAARGDVKTAGQDMADAPDPGHVASTVVPKMSAAAMKAKHVAPGTVLGSLYDNWAWENSEDALVAGAGQPQVRAGVLRIIATLPGVTVTSGTSGGVPTQVLTSGAQEVGSGYVEQVTINAATGIPISIAGGTPGQTLVPVTYKVSRVTLADIEAGKY
jgi:hypothetical protein